MYIIIDVSNAIGNKQAWIREKLRMGSMYQTYWDQIIVRDHASIKKTEIFVTLEIICLSHILRPPIFRPILIETKIM